MPKVDWQSLLLPGQRGLAVEGTHDQIIIRAFLDAGQNQGLWQDWRPLIRVESSDGGLNGVLSEVKNNAKVYGIIDGDWRNQAEVQTLKAENEAYDRLYVLPRVTIENYLINPVELGWILVALNQDDNFEQIKSEIEAQFDDWLQHGAVYQVLHDQKADYFCRDREGYPTALRQAPPIDENNIKHLLSNWHNQLNPDDFMQIYQETLQRFRAEKSYEQCIYKSCHGAKK